MSGLQAWSKVLLRMGKDLLINVYSLLLVVDELDPANVSDDAVCLLSSPARRVVAALGVVHVELRALEAAHAHTVALAHNLQRD